MGKRLCCLQNSCYLLSIIKCKLKFENSIPWFLIFEIWILTIKSWKLSCFDSCRNCLGEWAILSPASGKRSAVDYCSYNKTPVAINASFYSWRHGRLKRKKNIFHWSCHSTWDVKYIKALLGIKIKFLSGTKVKIKDDVKQVASNKSQDSRWWRGLRL